MIMGLVCWRCGQSLAGLPLPLGRSAECSACHASLHVCKLCEFYDPRVAEQCREPIADFVQDKERANFCDYFKPAPGAYTPPDEQAAHSAQADLNALFGIASGAEDTESNLPVVEKSRKKLDELFKK